MGKTRVPKPGRPAKTIATEAAERETAATSPRIRDRISELRRVRPAELRSNPKNWRTHPEAQRSALRALLEEIGFADALLARIDADRQLVLIDGHLRLEEAHPDDLLPVLVLDVDEAEADKLLATLDPLAAMATIDTKQLDELLRGIETSSEGLEQMLADLAKQTAKQQAPEIVEDEAPKVPTDPITQPGDLWILGTHRVLCGDCRNEDDVARLCEGEKIQIAFTSPPYAQQRQYDETSGFKPIPADEYVEWWQAVQAAIEKRIADDGSFFVNIKPAAEDLDTELYVFDLVVAMVRRWGWHFATELSWRRHGVPKQVILRFKNQFEPVYQFSRGRWKIRPDAVCHESNNVPLPFGAGAGDTSWKNRQGVGGVMPKKRRGKEVAGSAASHQGVVNPFAGRTIVAGLAYPGNLLPPFTSTHEALGHNAAFPVGLPAWFITAYTDAGDLVYEPFSGSGSTLIAAEQLGRRCRAMEISAGYCDVAVQRWQNLTGKKAERHE